MTKASCHCGAIQIEISEEPKWLVDCNCTVCRRIGALWAHIDLKNVVIDAEKEASIAYVQGDKMLAIHTCRTCGCTTHWEPLIPDESTTMAVNFRMCTIGDQAKYEIRKFDGADTWEFMPTT